MVNAALRPPTGRGSAKGAGGDGGGGMASGKEEEWQKVAFGGRFRSLSSRGT